MTASAPAARAARVLAKYIDAISEAINKNGGIVDDTPENESLFKALQNADLGYYLKDVSGLNLRRAVVQFVRHYERRHHYNISGGEVAALFREITRRAQLYQAARHANEEDRDDFRRQVEDAINDLSMVLGELAQHFARNVYEELLIIADLELRIRANEDALLRLKELNDALAGLSCDAVLEIAGRDPVLEPLLLRRLKPTIDYCQKSTVDAAHELNAHLLQWKKDQKAQRTHNLLNALMSHLRRHPSYAPDFEPIAPQVPAVFLGSRVCDLAYANLDDINAEVAFSKLAERAAERRAPPFTARDETPTPVTIAMDGEYREERDPLALALETFFAEAADPTGPQQWSARACFERLKPDCALDIWLAAVAAHARDFAPEALQLLREEQAVPYYDGNHLVLDLILARS